MGLSFLTPIAAVIAVAVVLPLAAFAAVELRARRVRAALRLPGPPRLTRIGPPVALAAVAALLALAASQPVLAKSATRPVRTDAEAFFVFDTSRSMLARRGREEPSRLERARAFAEQLRSAIPDVRVGLASLSDRVLPHLFPTVDDAVFLSVLRRSIGIEKPPPAELFMTRVSTFAPLAGLATQNFFSPAARRRLVVVFTDGETRPFDLQPIAHAVPRAGIASIFVHFWAADERVYSGGTPERSYRPDPTSGTALVRLAAAAGGQVFAEDELGRAVQTARDALGRGPELRVGQQRSQTSLAVYFALGAILPLSFVLWRRNLH